MRARVVSQKGFIYKSQAQPLKAHDKRYMAEATPKLSPKPCLLDTQEMSNFRVTHCFNRSRDGGLPRTEWKKQRAWVIL